MENLEFEKKRLAFFSFPLMISFLGSGSAYKMKVSIGQKVFLILIWEREGKEEGKGRVKL
jgi:hypothetical protein